MLSCWSIRTKLCLAIAILLVVVGILSFSSFRGVYSFRGLAKGISARAVELPLATKLSRHVTDLRSTFLSMTPTDVTPESPTHEQMELFDNSVSDQQFSVELSTLNDCMDHYQAALRRSETNRAAGISITDNHAEWETVFKIQQIINTVNTIRENNEWLRDDTSVVQMNMELTRLHKLTADLPGFLHDRMQSFAEETRVRYRTWIALTWVTSISAIPLLLLLGLWLYWWIFSPLRKILHGSRYIADGQFQHRIHLNSQDEMAELAGSMNNMTASFQKICTELDQQVQQRTQEVVRSEQLASVGFLAAGVSHEINNPLASIALCAESLEDRLHDIITTDEAGPEESQDEEITVVRSYLRMIQDEAFRCKQITEKLLDFSRLGDVEKHSTDLSALTKDVIEMVGHVGQYKQKEIRFKPSESVFAMVNDQEIKQVVLNLVTNALDSLNIGGHVDVSVNSNKDQALLTVSDNGCGMTEEVRKHLFEPFFTRRRDGQGTGLGMSISYRIVSDHGGTIDVYSAGPGSGSTLTVKIPHLQKSASKEPDHRQEKQAA